jgi:hypothetical protein
VLCEPQVLLASGGQKSADHIKQPSRASIDLLKNEDAINRLVAKLKVGRASQSFTDVTCMPARTLRRRQRPTSSSQLLAAGAQGRTLSICMLCP